MGRDPNESGTGNRRDGKGAKKGPTASRGGLYSFNPTEPQRMAIKALCEREGAVMACLDDLLMRGARITLGFDAKREAIFVIARENNSDWEAAYAVSTVHRDLWRALAAMAYATSEVNPAFPTEPFKGWSEVVDW